MNLIARPAFTSVIIDQVNTFASMKTAVNLTILDVLQKTISYIICKFILDIFRSGRISSVYIVSKWVGCGWVTLFLNV